MLGGIGYKAAYGLLHDGSICFFKIGNTLVQYFLHRYVLVIVSEEPALESAALSNLTEEVSQGILLEQASAECILNTAGVAVGDNDVVQSQSALSGVSLAVWYSSSLGSSSFHQNWWLT